MVSTCMLGGWQLELRHLVDEPLPLGKALRIDLAARRPVCVHRGLQLHDCNNSAREDALCLGNRLLRFDAHSVPTGARGGRRTATCKLMFAGKHLTRAALRAALRAAR